MYLKIYIKEQEGVWICVCDCIFVFLWGFLLVVEFLFFGVFLYCLVWFDLTCVLNPHP